MKNINWFRVSIIQAIILFVIIIVFVLSNVSTPKMNKTSNLHEYIEYNNTNDYYPVIVPDAKTAKIIGSRIIDNISGNHNFYITSVTIDYDEENRLWAVNKWYLFGGSGLVIIEQDSGKIIAALLTKF